MHSANDAVRSRPVDFDQVSARLIQASPRRQSSPPKYTAIERWALRHGASIESLRESDPPTPTSSGSKTPEDPYLQALRFEREDHGELVKDGGRPWYPIHLLEEVSRHPDKHREMLRYWQGGMMAGPDQWTVFGGQLIRWRQFRYWQAERREEFRGCIAEYTGWARKFLQNRHSYTAPIEFAFEEDPKRQDQLTTWIEYLAYECNFYAKRFEWHRRRQRWYNAQWEKLVDSGVLRPQETEEFICNPDSSFQRTSERIHAEKAMESARLGVPSVMHHSRQSQRRSAVTRSMLDPSVQSFESIKRRNDLISEFLQTTRSYREAKRNAERHGILLQWVKEQVSLIEVEPKQGKVAEDSSDARPGKSQGIKRARADEDTETEGHGNKRRKQDDEERAIPRPRGQTLKRTRDDNPVDHGVPSKRPKRGIDYTHVHGTSITSNCATTEPDKTSKGAAHIRFSDVPGSPAVVRHLRRSARQTVHRSGRKGNTPERSTNIADPSAVYEPLRRSARIADRQRRSGITIAPPRCAGSLRQGPRQVAGPPVDASRAIKRKDKSR